MLINAKEMDYKTLNEKLRFADEDVTIENCCGQRFIASAMSGHAVTIEGVPGNALGAYLNGVQITVYKNPATPHCISCRVTDISMYDYFPFIHSISDRILGISVNSDLSAI